ncbi:MAG: hypothetical protein COW30_14955, partial [Rhodospirillales bacterium CG15_BIG_FIL_POST_REV_8_21_14_020_66_15]
MPDVDLAAAPPGRAADAPPPRPSLSAWIYLALCAVAVAQGFWRPDGWQVAAVVLAAAYLALEFRRTSAIQRAVGYVLVLGGLALGWRAGQGVEVLLDGVASALKFQLVFFAVAWMQIPARTSPTLMAARQFVLDQPAGRRFLILAYAAHFLGAFLNLAALTLLSDMVARPRDRQLKDRLAVALMVGFTAASSWSPFYVSVTVVLAALPGLKWVDIAVPGLVMGVLIVAVTAVIDRVFVRGARPRPPAGPKVENANWGKLSMLLGALMVSVITLESQFHLSMPVVLALLAPPFAVIWLLISLGRGHEAPGLPRRVVASLPGLRGEALIFVGANLFGTGVARVLDPAAVADLLNIGAWPDAAKPLALAAFIILAGGVGLHPVVLV